MKNKDSLRRAIRELPEYTLRSGTWEALAQSLDDENQFSAALALLPERTPNADAWTGVEAALRPNQHVVVRRLWRYAAAVAALVVLSVGAYLFHQNTHSEASVVLTYHEEMVPSYDTELSTNDSLAQEAQTYIEQLCQKAPSATCQRSEFLALRAHLAELSEEEQALRRTIDQLGYDPQLIKYQVRIENMKADATKELIQMVIG